MADSRDLIEKIKAGETDSFQSLVKEYKRLVYNIVFRMVQNDADREDICQDVFVKVYQNLAGFQHESKLSTWIGRIAFNACVNCLTKKKVPLYDDYSAEGDSIENFIGEAKPPDDFTAEKDIANRLETEMSKLPAQLRTILTLYHVEEMSYAEIAKIMNMPDGTIKSYLFRARKMLKQRLMKKYHAEELWT